MINRLSPKDIRNKEINVKDLQLLQNSQPKMSYYYEPHMLTKLLESAGPLKLSKDKCIVTKHIEQIMDNIVKIVKFSYMLTNSIDQHTTLLLVVS